MGVDIGQRPRVNRSGLTGARLAAARVEEPETSTEIIKQTPDANLVASNVVGASVPGLDAEESLAEFRELVASAGGEVVAEVMQRRPRPDPATLVGAGKVEEIAGVAASTEADLVLFDHDLTPTQLRNL